MNSQSLWRCMSVAPWPRHVFSESIAGHAFFLCEPVILLHHHRMLCSFSSPRIALVVFFASIVTSREMSTQMDNTQMQCKCMCMHFTHTHTLNAHLIYTCMYLWIVYSPWCFIKCTYASAYPFASAHGSIIKSYHESQAL